MPTTTDLRNITPESIIEREIERAKTEVQPVSRRFLASLLVKEKGLTMKEADALVDSYCDEKAPFTPDYLTNEFLLPYIKLAGMFFVILSLVILGYGVKLWDTHVASWPYFLIGATLFLFSAIGLLKVIRLERESAS